ncbi:MAG: hypothetical protein IKX74_06955 [Erysipelotrichaceae bacterium]|nr:hypothetical protein [Erysipelotrichaceae bacterium]MBR5049360.1 hypothetical protein [Erysipelotrichaceae bacterium]
MKLLKALLVFILMMGISTAGVSANSALMYWYGSDNNDVYALSEDCPLQVTNEKLIFNINELPERGYDSTEAFNSIDSSVTAVYTFHNPADYDVNATLYFPFGSLPFYAPELDFLSSDLYAVVTDGKPADKQLRYYYQSGEFDIAKALNRLQDGKMDDPLFREDTVLTRYDYRIDTNEGIYCALTMASDKVAIISQLNGYNDDDGKIRFGIFYSREDDRIFSLYLIGEENYIEDVRFYQAADLKQEVSGHLTLTGSEKIMLTDLAEEVFDIEGISETDRYNCFISWLRDSLSDYPVIDLLNCRYVMHDGLICGYVYQLSVPAGQSVVNEVTAPLYPGIDGYYDPFYYDFTYLSSPARTWSSFGSLDIEIRTPHYVSQFNAGQLNKEEEGIYRAHLQGLPQKEITFRVCEVEKPNHNRNSSYNIISWMILGFFALCVLIVAVILALIIRALKRRRRRHH